jgi:catechol 2,3-dioxygenase-like lactoylglutathione lyase family enzyme
MRDGSNTNTNRVHMHACMRSYVAGTSATVGRMAAITGLRGVEHVGFTVPDVDDAVAFFVDVLGCERFYEMGPFADPEGSWMSDNLDVHPQAAIPKFALLRCANGANFEVFEYAAPDQRQEWPKMSDWGGVHIAFYVDDIDAALANLESHGVRILGGRKDGVGPEAGEGSAFAHWVAPWGQIFEFVSYPGGREYHQQSDRRLWQPE